MASTVAHPCVVQLLRKTGKPFAGVNDFARRCPAVRVFAYGSSPEEVSENAAIGLAMALGRRRWSRYHKVATCYYSKNVEWPRSYLVEDWSRQRGRVWVKRYWAHSPTPEIAAWAARAEISAAVGREKKHPDLLLFRDPLAPDASLGWKTTVHEFTDVKGVVAPHFQTSAMLDGFRMAMMAAISGAERSGKRPVDYFVAEALAASKNDAAALYSRVAHRPAARSLRRSGATPYGIAREIALERACDEFARMLRCDEHCAEEHQAFFTAIHSNLMRPVGANLVDVGPAEEADSEDLASCLGSDTLVAALDHAEARGDEEEFDLGGHSADSDRGDDLDRGSHHFDGDSQCDFGGSGQDDSGDEDDGSDDDSDDDSDDGGGWNDDDSGF